ncbi:hypothetical protein [Pseudoduganella albidiflava]|uniref:Uncharacterized protein n=1 Tax=Pseudoduganella albidiflava TaxID=321983 RepID=A0AA87XZ24_9BURK|nr:hypothetical protein [Pseudoduganella albidiflava]GGY61532.1 hypothetical protein GCM10007387_50100 [Pseudoduganella albidiflava]
MTYEEYLDEVTTLIFEKYDIPENDAVKIVMAAQDKEFFVPHDKSAKLRNIDQAHKDAKTLFEAAGVKSTAKSAAKPAVRTSASTAAKPAANVAAKPASKSASRPAARPATGGTPKPAVKTPK